MTAENSTKYQYLATICANLITIGYGAACGWTSPSFLVLQSDESPLESGPITTNEASWIGSLLCIGCLIGNILFGWIADIIGRKNSMLLIAIPQFTSWLLIIFAKNVMHLYISRILAGLAGGGAFVLIPLYVTEISEDSVRGTLGSCIILTSNFGLFLSFILGTFLPYAIVPFILIIFSILFVIGFTFLPETPQYLMKRQKTEEADKSLRYYRNIKGISQDLPECFKNEMEKLKLSCSDNEKRSNNSSLSLSDFKKKSTKKAFIIGIALMLLNQLCGCFTMMNYTAQIFKESGSSLSPNLSAIIVGLIQLIGSYFSTLLVEKAGRKFLICFSTFGTGIGLSCLGSYMYLKILNFDVTGFEWIPVTSFSITIFIAAWGILTLPFLVLSEIMPTKLRTIGSSFCMSLFWIFSFAMVKVFPFLIEMLGLHGSMFSFAAFSFAGATFVLFFVPETKGKSLEAIIKMLE